MEEIKSLKKLAKRSFFAIIFVILGVFLMLSGMVSLLAALISGLLLLVVKKYPDDSMYYVFAYSSSILVFNMIFFLCHRFIMHRKFKKCSKALGKTWKPKDCLGFPGESIIAFDQSERKIYFLNLNKKQYVAKDFSFIRSWEFSVKRVMNKYEHELIINTNDLETPVMSMKLKNEDKATIWQAKMSIILDGRPIL